MMNESDTDSRLTRIWQEHRKRMRVRLKRRRTRRHIPRPDRTAQELVGYLRERNIRTTGQLCRLREADGPTVPDYIKTFSRWSEAVRQVFGPPPPRIKFPASRQHIIDMVVQLGVRSRSQYIARRKELPELVASLNQVRKFFGSFSEVLDEAASRSAEITLGRYLELWQRLRRRPDHEDCERWKVDLAPLRRMFPSKRELDGFLAIIDKPANQDWVRCAVSRTFGRKSRPREQSVLDYNALPEKGSCPRVAAG